MHLPLLALMWVLAVFAALSCSVLVAIFVTLFADSIADARDNHRRRVHDEAVRADWRARKRTVDNDRDVLLKEINAAVGVVQAFARGVSGQKPESPWDTVARVRIKG